MKVQVEDIPGQAEPGIEITSQDPGEAGLLTLMWLRGITAVSIEHVPRKGIKLTIAMREEQEEA